METQCFAQLAQVQMMQQADDAEYKVLARGENALPGEDAAVLRDYFNAGTSLNQLAELWAKSDPRFRNVHPYFPGRRLLHHHNAKIPDLVRR